MALVIIKPINEASFTQVVFRSQCPYQDVDRLLRESIYNKVHKRLPAVTWKVAESNNIISAMVEMHHL